MNESETASDGLLASVIIVNYEGYDDLTDCLPSVLNQSIESYEVILVDNDSNDHSVEYVREHFPEVRIVENEENRWFAGGNNDGMAVAKGDYLVGINQDVEVEEDWLETLLAPFEEDGRVGLTTSRVIKYDDRRILNTCGNILHCTGLGFCRGLDEPVGEYGRQELVPAISGCSFAIRRDVYQEIGGFDESFQMYKEDVDLSWRAQLAGYDIVYVPDSIVYHKYTVSVSSGKLFNLERNRYQILLKHLHRRTLLWLLPGLLLTELLVWMYSVSKGKTGVEQKAASWRWLIEHRDDIRQKRSTVQSFRRRSDQELLSATTPTLPVEQLGVPPFGQSVISSLFRLSYLPWYYFATKATPVLSSPG